MSTARLKHLLQPGRIGKLELRNRIFMAPMGTFLAREDGHIDERHKLYYETRARGGAALLTVEVAAIDHPRGAAMTHQLGLSEDAFIPGLADLTHRIHHYGAKASIQLHHAGKIATKDLAEGRPFSVPSANVGAAMSGVLEDLTAEEIQDVTKIYGSIPAGGMFHELSVDEIQRIILRYAEAAGRAQRAGFDAVEIHAGHGYLIAEFLSRSSNHRQDEYGGKLENRARLLLEVIRTVRENVGPDFPIWCRMDGKEFGIEDGITVEDAQATARLAVHAGLDAIHVTAYGGPSGIGVTEAMLVHPEAQLLPLAAGIKRVVDVPVIAVGRLTPEVANRAIAEGKADFIAMARPLLADPELPLKLMEGRPEDIRPCIYCYVCVGQIFVNKHVKCAVNPATAHEAEFAISPATSPKHVLVVGGGPAGMEAARVAALRGHRVTLCEKEPRLGGTAYFSSLVWEENGKLVTYLETQIRKLPIDLRLGTEVDVALVRELAPEVTLLALGAKREAPALPGADLPHVLSGDELRELLTGSSSAAEAKLSFAQSSLLRAGHALLGLASHIERVRELSKHWMPLGQRIVILGGGLVGLELAEFLAERGRKVTVLEEGPHLAPQMAIPRRWRTLHELRTRDTALHTGVRVHAIEKVGVVVSLGDEKRTIPADQVILASSVVPNHDIAPAIEALGGELHRIGDCDELGYIEGAILAGARIARSI